ncbi:MAG: hypothetical protein CFH39_01928, partial [Alphaproteobacteria bacterium MarineAlpha10_Bin2]
GGKIFTPEHFEERLRHVIGVKKKKKRELPTLQE